MELSYGTDFNKFKKCYTNNNYVSDYEEETILLQESITFVYKPNNPDERHSSQATILGFAEVNPSIVLFENLSNQYQGGQFSRIDVIFGKYLWTDPITKKAYKKKWWAYYTSVEGASGIAPLCEIPINKHYKDYTFLVQASFREVCVYTFKYWVEQAKNIREHFIMDEK